MLADPSGDAEYRQDLRGLIVQCYARQEQGRLELMCSDEARLAARQEELANAIIRSGQDFKNDDHLGKERRDQLAKELQRLAPAEFKGYADNLGVAELLALDGLLAQDKRLNEKFLPYANTIRKVDLDTTLRGKLDHLKELEGRQFSPQARGLLLQAVQDNFRLGLKCDVARAACLGGVSISMRPSANPGKSNGFSLCASLRRNHESYCDSTLATCKILSQGGKDTVVPATAASPYYHSEGDWPEFFWRKADADFSTKPATTCLDLSLELREENIE